MKSKGKILIIGPIAPPAGGVSIHIERLVELLKADYMFDFVDESAIIKHNYFNIRNYNAFKYLHKIMKSDILYIHSGNKSLKKIHILFGKIFRKKIIITFHGFGSFENSNNTILDNYFYTLVNKIIVVNKEIANVFKINTKKCIVRHAFLPPQLQLENELPENLNNLILQANLFNKTILCSNASRLNIYMNQDLYGLDMCIELSYRLKINSIPFFFVFNISSLDEGKSIFIKAKEKISEYHLDSDFLLINENISFVKLIEKSDIVLRTTNTDGDAISVREGLLLNKTVIASDVVKRPKGVILFETRNSDDLFLKCISNINEKRDIEDCQQLCSSQMNENKVFYKELIEELL